MHTASARCWAWLWVLAWVVSAPARAATTLVEVTSSPDIAIAVDGGSLLVEAEDAVVDDGATPALADLGSLPAGANLAAYHLLWTGDQLFCLDVPAELSGPLAVEPRDVVRYDGGSYTIEFDGSAEGVPPGAGIDAVTLADDGDLLLSFDTTVSLPGGTFDPEDLVRFDDTGGTFSSLFDGSAAGVAAGLDLDAAHYLFGADKLLVSFDGSGSISSVGFDDEDVLERDLLGSSWELALDTDASEAAWSPANLTALYAIRAGDSDTDDLSDLDELRTHGTNPFDADTDGDGRDDGDEIALGTDPNDPDTDDDTICDGGGTGGGACTAGPDNCPFIPNSDQTNSDALPAGDDCQCGDLDENGIVELADATIARQHLVGATIGVAHDLEHRCNVVGPLDPEETGADCDVADIFLIRRFLAEPSTELGNVCSAYYGAP